VVAAWRARGVNFYGIGIIRIRPRLDKVSYESEATRASVFCEVFAKHIF
jgi:hypothetical protein